MNNHLNLRARATPTDFEPATRRDRAARYQLRYGALLESTEVNSISSTLALQIVRFGTPTDLNPCYRRERAAAS